MGSSTAIAILSAICSNGDTAADGAAAGRASRGRQRPSPSVFSLQFQCEAVRDAPLSYNYNDLAINVGDDWFISLYLTLLFVYAAGVPRRRWRWPPAGKRESASGARTAAINGFSFRGALLCTANGPVRTESPLVLAVHVWVLGWIVILPQPQRDDKPINMEHVLLVKYVPRTAVEDFRYATRALFLHSFMHQRSCLPRGPTCPGRACLRGAQVSKNAVSLWLFVIVTKLHNCIFNFSSPSLPEM